MQMMKLVFERINNLDKKIEELDNKINGIVKAISKDLDDNHDDMHKHVNDLSCMINQLRFDMINKDSEIMLENNELSKRIDNLEEENLVIPRLDITELVEEANEKFRNINKN